MNKTEVKIFESFLKSRKNNLYFNELQNLTKASNSSLQNVLLKFEMQGILAKEKTKSNVFYQIKDIKIFSLEFSKLAYRKFNSLNLGVRVPLRNFLKEVSQNVFTIILFGSASIGEEVQGSDIDILIVSNKKENFEKLKNKINIVSNYPISIFNCNINDFENSNDNIIIQAKKTGFPIFKEQNFYEVLINEYTKTI